ncbi:hypothetical protein FE773_07930 [Caminibacter mediatlanticus TB-2]|uniref:Cell division protein FtsX n=3 Tax=Caminibacter mediatlanticus TaxID=291048 RepID=A0ABX5VAU4_9BACT|nr:hypothetical protein [Caminibacter mediatlanticus]QCT95119.1 hypothetical protein FE773_07930 [Caminibacter mediatlanticus TB-2]
MNYLKSHITLILSLISILISIFMFRTFDNILKLYEQNIVNNYSIVVVSDSIINNLDIPQIKKIEKIDIKEQISALQQKYPNINFKNIKLPYFYNLKLNYLPSPNELKNLKNSLLNKPFIKRVLTHSTSQTKIYNLLMLLKSITKTFMFITAILGTLLIIKQLEVWKLLHSERMYIMELFGAPFWIKGAALFKIAIIDSFIAIIITLGLIYFITNSIIFESIINELNINFKINYLQEFGILFIVSFAISLISSIIVVMSKK